MKIGKSSFVFKEVYLEETAVAIGSLEAKGKMKSYADIVYDDEYFNEKSYEAAERKMQKETINKLNLHLIINRYFYQLNIFYFLIY